ncbi:DUF6642 family protein [Myroides odoratimimus]|uniref:DUF6642 family protein n=1 Tax=Myroides odoratimimus TaxID=76832 RepID=UPI003D2F7F4F
MREYLGSNIFCLEGDWEIDLRKKTSILAGLEMLHSISDVEFIYKTCGTVEELLYRLNDFVKHKRSKYKNYNILYLATHGAKGEMYYGDSINVLLFFKKHFKKGDFEGRVIHFGSCATLHIKEEDLSELKAYTGAKIISGYSKQVDFLESTMFDVLYFRKLQFRKLVTPLDEALYNEYKGMYDSLGFVIR